MHHPGDREQAHVAKCGAGRLVITSPFSTNPRRCHRVPGHWLLLERCIFDCVLLHMVLCSSSEVVLQSPPRSSTRQLKMTGVSSSVRRRARCFTSLQKCALNYSKSSLVHFLIWKGTAWCPLGLDILSRPMLQQNHQDIYYGTRLFVVGGITTCLIALNDLFGFWCLALLKYVPIALIENLF